MLRLRMFAKKYNLGYGGLTPYGLEFGLRVIFISRLYTWVSIVERTAVYDSEPLYSMYSTACPDGECVMYGTPEKGWGPRRHGFFIAMSVPLGLSRQYGSGKPSHECTIYITSPAPPPCPSLLDQA